MINPGTVLQERYLIEKQIGEGGMGAVYLAVDQRFDNFVAIKVTFYKDNEFGEAFEREARILNGLLHPVLPHVSDYFTEGDEHYLVMQFIEGEDASAILKREGAFPVRDVFRWTENLLDALDYLHSQAPPIIHRDIKPSNLKITPRGDIFLLDFGLAKMKKENTLTERSVFGYSRKYSPLEQIQGTGTDVRSDIFALAATVYHLFTGQPPVDAIARASAIVAGKADPVLPADVLNAEIPPGVANVLSSALALNAENRFASAKAMHQALKHAVQGTSLENIEPQPAVPVLATETNAKIIDSSENENFPALEAFAADKTGESPALVENQQFVGEIPPTDVQVSTPQPAENFQRAAEIPTAVAPRRRKSRFPIAAALVLLAIVVTATAIFLTKDRKTVVSSAPPPEVSAETDTSLNEAETVSENVATSSVPDLLETTEVEMADSKPSVKKTSGKPDPEEKPVVEDEVREAPQPRSSKKEIRRPAQKPAATNGERRERVVRSENVPDIESIFTGRPSRERDERLRRREERRRMKEVMTEEEFREYRRQRRRARRQDAYPFPF